jgi:hypothetical protein
VRGGVTGERGGGDEGVEVFVEGRGRSGEKAGVDDWRREIVGKLVKKASRTEGYSTHRRADPLYYAPLTS